MQKATFQYFLFKHCARPVPPSLINMTLKQETFMMTTSYKAQSVEPVDVFYERLARLTRPWSCCCMAIPPPAICSGIPSSTKQA